MVKPKTACLYHQNTRSGCEGKNNCMYYRYFPPETSPEIYKEIKQMYGLKKIRSLLQNAQSKPLEYPRFDVDQKMLAMHYQAFIRKHQNNLEIADGAYSEMIRSLARNERDNSLRSPEEMSNMVRETIEHLKNVLNGCRGDFFMYRKKLEDLCQQHSYLVVPPPISFEDQDTLPGLQDGEDILPHILNNFKEEILKYRDAIKKTSLLFSSLQKIVDSIEKNPNRKELLELNLNSEECFQASIRWSVEFVEQEDWPEADDDNPEEDNDGAGAGMGNRDVDAAGEPGAGAAGEPSDGDPGRAPKRTCIRD